jgi:hypothetical protein
MSDRGNLRLIRGARKAATERMRKKPKPSFENVEFKAAIPRHTAPRNIKINFKARFVFFSLSITGVSLIGKNVGKKVKSFTRNLMQFSIF